MRFYVKIFLLKNQIKIKKKVYFNAKITQSILNSKPFSIIQTWNQSYKNLSKINFRFKISYSI